MKKRTPGGARRRKKRHTEDAPLETFESLGKRFEKYRDRIEIKDFRTTDERTEHIRSIAGALEDIEAELRERVIAIEQHLGRSDTFLILSAVSIRNHAVDPETFKEYSFKGIPLAAEFAAILALKHPYTDAPPKIPFSAALHEIQEELEAATMHLTPLLRMARIARQAIDSDDIESLASKGESLRFGAFMHELVVRSPAYPHHHGDILLGLFAPFDQPLLDTLGYTVRDALCLCKALADLIDSRLKERSELARDAARDLKRALSTARRKPPQPGSAPASVSLPRGPNFPEEFIRLPRSEAERALDTIMNDWFLIGADTICCFTVDDLVGKVDISRERTCCFLRSMAIAFGGVSNDVFEPSPTHELRSRPLLVHNERYFCPAPLLLTWAIQPALEKALKEAGSFWARYESHRHEWLLERGVALLQKAMPSATFDAHLEYDVEDSSERCELDTLAIYDSLAFFIEAKGGDLTAPARRGAPLRLFRDLRKIVGDSHSQARRAREYFCSAPTVRFRAGKDTRDFTRARAEVSRTILVSLSLAPIGHITPFLTEEAAPGLFATGEYSWVVSIHDLMVLCDVIELPPMLPHFVFERLRLARTGNPTAVTELDLFGCYLSPDRLFGEAGGRERSLMRRGAILATYTTQFDEYFAYLTGARRRTASRPRQRMSADIRLLLERLEKSALAGRLEAAFFILDLSEDDRKVVRRLVRRVQRVSRRDRDCSHATFESSRKPGRTMAYFCDFDTGRLERTIAAHAAEARARTATTTSTWIGVGEAGDAPELRTWSICVVGAGVN